MRKPLNKPALRPLHNQDSDRAILKRKIQLKTQQIQINKKERRKYIRKLVLSELKDSWEAQIGKEFDPVLSRKLDCIIYILENWK